MVPARALGALFSLSLLVLLLTGCAGTESFSRYARAGDTISLAAGWRQDLNKNNITITITPTSTGIPIVLESGHPAIRAVFNLYPDPLSSLVVSPQIREDLTPYAQTYSGMLQVLYTEQDKDLSQTVVFLDLPADLPAGRAYIRISGGDYEDTPRAIVEIIDGSGFPAMFNTEGGGLSANHLRALERVESRMVTFLGGVLPHAIQVDLRHEADRDSGGSGKAHVVNPRSEKSILWSSDGTHIRVVLLPPGGEGAGNLSDFKFHIVGGVIGLEIEDVKAYDAEGNLLTGIAATLD